MAGLGPHSGDAREVGTVDAHPAAPLALELCRYLVDIEILPRNPVKDVGGAGKLEPKVVWLSVPEMMRLIDAHPEPYRTLSMLLHGSGLEIGAALALRKRDLIPEHRAIRAPGTKNF